MICRIKNHLISSFHYHHFAFTAVKIQLELLIFVGDVEWLFECGSVAFLRTPAQGVFDAVFAKHQRHIGFGFHFKTGHHFLHTVLIVKFHSFFVSYIAQVCQFLFRKYNVSSSRFSFADYVRFLAGFFQQINNLPTPLVQLRSRSKPGSRRVNFNFIGFVNCISEFG